MCHTSLSEVRSAVLGLAADVSPEEIELDENGELKDPESFILTQARLPRLSMYWELAASPWRGLVWFREPRVVREREWKREQGCVPTLLQSTF